MRNKWCHYAILLGWALGMCVPGLATAQDQDELPSRLPESGLAVLDCAPAAPAPKESCLIRVPADYGFKDVVSSDAASRKAEFRIARSGSDLPNGLVHSSTLVLIDLSLGEGNGRRATWQRERAAISALIGSLDDAGELAVYGFGDELVRLSGFSSGRAAALSAVEGLELTELLTVLGSNVTEAIEVLKSRDKSLFKNIILITDGDEEGGVDHAAVRQAAVKEGVSIATLGMMWRRENANENAEGIDVLRSLTVPQNALKDVVFLRSDEAAVIAARRFGTTFSRTTSRSALILPVGDPTAAEIRLTLNVPIPGQARETKEQIYEVAFVPETSPALPAPETAPPEPEPEPVQLIFGFPALYVYVAIGGAVCLLMLVLALLMRATSRARGAPEDVLGEPYGDPPGFGVEPSDGGDPFDDEPVLVAGGGAPGAAAVSTPAVSAYLLRLDTGEKLPVGGPRLSIGRSSSNEIVVPDHGISRVHAELFKNGKGGYSISDLDSLNGTFVNEQKVTGTVPLRIGDTLGLGKTVRAKLVLP